MSSHHQWVDEIVKHHDEQKPFAPENGTPLAFKAGDSVTYTNSFGVSFNRTVTGIYQPSQPCSLYATGCRYLLDTDSHWMPVDEASLKHLQARAEQLPQALK
jgi:hypothetical protein